MAFAHNAHLHRGQSRWETHWPGGPDVLTWWPAGAHLAEILGPRYAAVGTAVGVSEANGVAQPETGTLEARLAAVSGPELFIPTHLGKGLPATEIQALPARTLSAKNYSYTSGLTARSFGDFDWFAFLDSTKYAQGAPPPQE